MSGVVPVPPSGIPSIATSVLSLLGSVLTVLLGPLILRWYGARLVKARDHDLQAPAAEFDYRKEELKSAVEVREWMMEDYRAMRERVRALEAQLADHRMLESQVQELREQLDAYRRGGADVHAAR